MFDGIDKDSKRYFDSLSLEIAPLGTYTNDFDWRYSMNVD